ncbi:unnamed protein product (macronuclear) [Paramecium tetraurelia]|uniref:RING-type domain-containing protein n=1 Tax=Paramecium tetraurelia TaxID=5888 RepID=A0DUV3_PARTE|nr:uncharacterized protein GSPATT00020482001 [Paramecium tetraurelia]CAK86820.1 unnamed protein product [Paramecium tetraurelia]|eukprot:XP_001454217.1 hypothetical protein (macronuclear) [Paramecium tetraurelia strain d4-2]
MNEQDDEMLIEEILCCQNDDDIRSLVDSQCLDIIGNSLQDQLTLAHKQLFRVIKLFREFLDSSRNQFWDQKKKREQNQTLQQDYLIIHHELQLEKSRGKQIEEANNQLRLQIKLYEGDFETIRQQSFEDIKKVEEQLVKTQNQISLYKNSLIQKFCVICLQKEYCILLKPCGHVCVCEECSKKIDQCPIDRVKVTKMNKVYLS